MNFEGKKYVSPTVETMDFNPLAVICLSNGNESLYEEDFGDGGFSEKW